MSLLLSTRPTRNDWLKTLYKAGLLVADTKTRDLADKLHLSRTLEAFVGPTFFHYHPKTIGLREFVRAHKLSDSLSRPEAVRAALAAEFPHGAIVKPTAVINTGGETQGYFFDDETIIAALANDESLRQAALRTEPYRSPLLDAVVSGEEFILQENVPSAAGYPPRKAKSYAEVRVHTFEGHTVPGALFSRWKIRPVDENRKFLIAESLVEDMLSRLPADFLRGQAWGLDVLVFDNGVSRIIDVNTNRGQRGQWSGYLARPELLRAYTRFLEAQKDVRFTGWRGSLLRHGWGNYLKYKKKYYIEGIR